MTAPTLTRPKDEIEAAVMVDLVSSFIAQKVRALGTKGLISDYPIGRRERGLCELSVDYHKTRGCRMVRRTTDKRGAWCKPKASTYYDKGLIVVADIVGIGPCWLVLSPAGVWLKRANFDGVSIALGPTEWGPPRREDHTYTMEVRSFQIGGGGLVPTKEPERTTHTTKADPPELCDAYDLWIEQLKPIMADVARKAKENPAQIWDQPEESCPSQ